MRIIFMGSPDFAVPALNALVEAGHELIAVYCQPPRPAGRGKADRKTPVHERADQLGLILPRPVLERPKMGCVNIHASLLPRWRGAAPIQRAILAGDTASGVTIMQMDEGLDTGPMLLKRELQLDRKNAGQVTEELAKLGAVALLEWIDAPSRPQPQPEDGTTYAPKVDKAEARIDWTMSAEEIERQVRAFAPWPGAWFEANGERIKLLDARAGDDASGTPGQVLDDCLNIAAGEGYVRALRVQRAGKNAMTVDELLRGFAIPKGTILP